MEPWEKALIDGETFPDDVHGQVACTDCHGGVQSAQKSEAHTGLIARPSEDATTACAKCHPDVVAMNQDSLHATLGGYWTVLEARGASQDHEDMTVAFGNHCQSCHTSCGDCHVSQPAPVGGGLVDGHNFNALPSMTQNCTACHGSRVGNEYLGKHEGILADVHFRQGRMTCMDCHGGHELHGQPAQCDQCHTTPETETVPPPEHRYDSVQTPRCESCHVTASSGQDGIEMHVAHGSDLSCQVCHSVSYSSCDGCHVAISESTGNPFFATEATYLTFLIGRNAIASFERPYRFVPVRHVPVAEDSFAYYGDNMLPDFNELPTWAYATPHNIQRETPQAASCDACHGNPDLFLTADKVAPDELEANRPVIIDSIPAPIDAISTTLPITTTNVITTTGVLTDTGNTDD